MTKQSTWIPKDPPLKVGEMVVVTSKYSKLKERQGKIMAILGPLESPHIRTDRWMSDFLEDEIERPNACN